MRREGLTELRAATSLETTSRQAQTDIAVIVRDLGAEITPDVLAKALAGDATPPPVITLAPARVPDSSEIVPRDGIRKRGRAFQPYRRGKLLRMCILSPRIDLVVHLRLMEAEID